MATLKDKPIQVNLVGHPFAPIGMGEHLRCTYRSMRAVYLNPTLTDIYKLVPPDDAERKEFSSNVTDQASDINIYHINGNEVEQVLKHLGHYRQWSGRNIIYPLWELEKYPMEWALQLEKFDEIWAPSKFIFNGIREACGKPVFHMPLSCEVGMTSFKGRRYFGIPETDYTFLFFYDLRSYSTRKNPQAVVNAFRKLLEERPFSKAHLVIKVNGVETNPDGFSQVRRFVEDIKGSVTLFHKTMSSNEVKNLVRCCDCFVSLHRSEGYGFGIAEAMVLGKPVIATAYSGNMDFMNPNFSYGVKYQLIPVREGEYPYFQNQVWAEPDWREASEYMINLLDNPSEGRRRGELASRHMKIEFGYRSIGQRYLTRLRGLVG